MLTRRQIPNLLTGIRVVAVPVALGMMLWLPEWPQGLLAVFVVASITDFFDGYLARKWNAITPLGTLLDPIADKLLVALMLLYLLAVQRPEHDEMDIFIPVAVILLRELYISGLREFLAARSIALPVSKGGKLKTTLQMLGIALMLATPAFDWTPAMVIGSGLLWLAAVVAFITAAQYTQASWKYVSTQ